jgi:hypothetical protein
MGRSIFKMMTKKFVSHFSSVNSDNLRNGDNSGWTLGHDMAKNGHKFSVTELVSFGNPSVTGNIPFHSRPIGWTVAHEMASQGHIFATHELETLCNPATEDADVFTGRQGYGWTIAHEMADKGHRFTIDDILELGNPQNRDGISISDLMAIKGRIFSTEELKKLGDAAHIKGCGGRGIYLTYYGNQPVFMDRGGIGQKIWLKFDEYQYVNDEELYDYPVICEINILHVNGNYRATLSVIKDDTASNGGESPHILESGGLVDIINQAMTSRETYSLAENINYMKSACGLSLVPIVYMEYECMREITGKE